MEWQNKASWLLLAAAMIIGALAISVGNAVLFVAGGAGGFLSRLARAMNRDTVPLDYGASWTTLFLSPFFGALVGWFGVALITVAVQPNINLLGDAFRVVDWYTPMAPATLAIAFLLGFSERFFDAVIGAVEGHAAKAGSGATVTGLVTTSPPPSRPPAGGAVRVPPSSPGSGAVGLRIDLVDTPITPVQPVSGKIVLGGPAATETGISLSVDNEHFAISPVALSIPAGGTEGEFDVVPKGSPAPSLVRVTARMGHTVVSDTIEYR